MLPHRAVPCKPLGALLLQQRRHCPFFAGKGPYLAQRPAFLELSSERGVMLPSLEDAVQRFMRDLPEL
jgi:hypothetical protein